MNQVPPPPPPPPPPGGAGGGYVGPTGGAGSANPWDIGAAFNWAWEKFTKNWSPWVLAALAVMAAWIVAIIIWIVLLAVVGGSSIGSLLVLGIGFAVFLVLSLGSGYPLIMGAIQQARGETPTVQSMFNFEAFGPYFITVLALSVAVGIGFLLCVIPGIIVAFLFYFAPFFAADKKLGVGETFKKSYELVTSNVGPVLLFIIVVALVNSVPSSVCFVLVLASAPVSLLMTVHGYKKAIGESVAP